MGRRLAAILAVDVVGYSRLMGVDEAGTLNVLKSHRSNLIDANIAEHQGRIFKLTRDGLLAEFPSVVNAVACAVAIQCGMKGRNGAATPNRRIEFRAGINLGDVIVDDGDVYGDGVNVAARLETVAEPGGIVVSAAVRDNVGNRLDLRFEDLGELTFKNIDKPIRVYSIPLEQSGAPRSQVNSRGIEKPSIAVLPFENMSGDPEQEYFSDGITEDIITDLSKISGLFVVARNTVFTYKNRAVRIQQITEELKIMYVLEGSVRKAGTRVRINAQLIDGNDGGHLWAERYDRDLTDIFAIQDEVTSTIVGQLKVRLLPAERKIIEHAPTGNIDAYTFYLRGRQFAHRHTKSYYILARRMFAKVVELDPLYARAYAGIADCDSFLCLHYHAEISPESILATSAKALELESNLAEAHASRGLALSICERYQEATAEFEQAIACDSNLFEAHYFYARACFAQGRIKEAARLFERATEIEPDDYQLPILLIQIYRSLNRNSELKRLHARVSHVQNASFSYIRKPRGRPI